MIKRGFVVIIVFVLLVSFTACEAKDNNHKDTPSDKNGDTNNESSDLEGLGVLFDEGLSNARIVCNRDANNMSSIYQVQWISDEEILFNNKIINETSESNVFYSFDTTNNTLQERFNIKERIWAGHIVDKGKSLIYSSDGFNGLYSLNDNGTIVKISKQQSWYNISPDSMKIIINGIPDGGEENEEFRRYLYHIGDNTLIELSDIPNIEYVFSNIAATWSPDSTHVVSQNGDNQNNLSIINVLENKIIEKIKIQDAIISPFPAWSPDGEKLAFVVQSKENRDYTFDDGHMYIYMSDKIGIYNVVDRTVEYYDLENKLTLDNSIRWEENSRGVIVQTLEKSLADVYTSKDASIGEVITTSFDYVNIDPTTGITTILSDNIRKLGEFYEHNRYFVGLYNGNTLVYTEIVDEQYIIGFLNIGNNSLTQLKDNGGYLKRVYNSGEGIYAVTPRGIFFIDNSLEYRQIFDFEPYFKDEVIGVDGFISPDFTKAAIQVECDPTSLQKDFIEIVDINK